MSAANAKLADEFPLHWPIWHNDLDGLRQRLGNVPKVPITEIDGGGNTLQNGRNELEKKDPRGRTPLMLAVTLGHFECAKLLLDHKADANAENRAYWSIVHEATSTGDPELLRLAVHHRTYQRTVRMALAFRRLLKQLQDGPDFYAEIDWKFSSWLPFVTQMCPSDTYKVYKCGARVRIDTTLAGISSSALDGTATSGGGTGSYWQRANLSYRFSISKKEDGREVPEISLVDHDKRLVQVMPTLSDEELNRLLAAEHSQATNDVFSESSPSPEEVSMRLTSPITTTYVDIDKIEFERSKRTGLSSWFYNEERREKINGYNCMVCTASNVELVTKTRTEHLSEHDKRANEEIDKSTNSVGGFNVMELLFGKQQQHEVPSTLHAESVTASNPFGINPDEYFNGYVELGSRDVGRPKEVTRRSNSFKATLWLAERFPLDLQEQVIPIIDLMASSNAHFARLKNFISLQLPAGFPVRIQLPLFHVFTSEVTFGNVQAVEKPVPGVHAISSSATDDSASSSMTDPDVASDVPTDVVVQIDESVFDVDPSYQRVTIGGSPMAGGGATRNGGGGRTTTTAGSRMVRGWGVEDEEDMMLQLAIQQSLMRGLVEDEATTDDVQAVEQVALQADASMYVHDDDLLQQVLAQSLNEQSARHLEEQRELDELQRAIELSKLQS